MEIRHSSYIYMIAAIAMLFSTPFVQAQDRRAKELVAQGDSLRNIYRFNESVECYTGALRLLDEA